MPIYIKECIIMMDLVNQIPSLIMNLVNLQQQQPQFLPNSYMIKHTQGVHIIYECNGFLNLSMA